MPVPPERIRALNEAPVRAERRFVVHWMTMNRRTRGNPALERAVELGRQLSRPVLVLEALRCGYPYASDRFHAFLLQGMADNARRLAGKALYHPWLERRPGEGKGLLAALATHACAVVADDHPGFFFPHMLAAAARALEAVDGSCLVPFRLSGREFPTAFAYRSFLQKELPAWLLRLPARDPLARAPAPGRTVVPEEVRRRWPAEEPARLERPERLLAELPIDHRVGAVGMRGGGTEGEARLAAFVRKRLGRYDEDRSDPDADGTSGLSPWLHYGHLGVFDAVRAVLGHEDWSPEWLARRGRGTRAGARAGWWGTSPAAEAFLDQLVTWRGLGFVSCAFGPEQGRWGSLPAWARATLEKHAGDLRPHRRSRAELAAARTPDRLWNAAQRQLLGDGVIHNSLRMLWGKKILEWSDSPREALANLLDLNDRYALDGRDPNSLTGILWTLGKYDRPWGPERPIFGTVRYMSSENARRKLDLDGYLQRWAPEEP